MAIEKAIHDLFRAAKEKDEFEFVSTLINYRGMGHKMGNSNLYEWFNAVEYYQTLYKDADTQEKKTRIGLLIYSAFFESSDLHNILGSMARIQQGFRSSSYLFFKHERTGKWLGIKEKIGMVEELLLDSGNDEIQQFFERNFVKELRNSFIHSSYSIMDNEFLVVDGDAIKVEGVGKYFVNVDEFILPKVNEILDFFVAFKNEFLTHFASYKENKLVKGRFPELMDIVILGSADGIKGFVAGGSYIKEESDGMWTAMNIRFNHMSEEDLAVKDEIDYFLKKQSIKTNDGRLQKLYEWVLQRNNAGEKENLSIIYERFAEKVRDAARTEQNHFKSSDLYERALIFYQKSMELSKNRNCRHNMAIVKAMVADRKSETNLDVEAASDFIQCLKEKVELNVVKNLSVILTTLKRRKKDISELRSETKKIISAAGEIENKNDIEAALAEIEKL